jgi:peptidoglycan-associated lipoprotein
MKGAGIKLASIVMAAFLLAACSSNSTKDDSANQRANVEDRGTNRDSEDDAQAQTHGLDDDRSLTAEALDDPESPLAVRVIYFDLDSANIRSDFSDTVTAHANYLAVNPTASVTLEGHADERGTPEYNLALGERRALAVRRHLVLLGASAGQIRTVSYGEERPAEDGHDEYVYSQNRRVELVY